jgi:hypothetical protein
VTATVAFTLIALVLLAVMAVQPLIAHQPEVARMSNPYAVPSTFTVHYHPCCGVLVGEEHDCARFAAEAMARIDNARAQAVTEWTAEADLGPEPPFLAAMRAAVISPGATA